MSHVDLQWFMENTHKVVCLDANLLSLSVNYDLNVC